MTEKEFIEAYCIWCDIEEYKEARWGEKCSIYKRCYERWGEK